MSWSNRNGTSKNGDEASAIADQAGAGAANTDLGPHHKEEEVKIVETMPPGETAEAPDAPALLVAPAPTEEEQRKKINRVVIGDRIIEFRGQHKQDLFLYEIFFKDQPAGTFFECGALDGIYLSNTYALEHFFGWRGVLVEPLTHQHEALKVNRPNSLCHNACVGPKAETVLFFNHKGGGLSGIVKEVGRKHIERLEFSYANHPPAYIRNPDLLKLEWKPVILTTDAIRQAGITHIDFFSLDVEGGEYAVLQGLDLDEIEVDVFCIEINPQSAPEVNALLTEKGFKPIASVGQDIIYVRLGYLEQVEARGVDWKQRMANSSVRHKSKLG